MPFSSRARAHESGRRRRFPSIANAFVEVGQYEVRDLPSRGPIAWVMFPVPADGTRCPRLARCIGPSSSDMVRGAGPFGWPWQERRLFSDTLVRLDNISRE